AGTVRSEVDSRRVGALDQVQLTLTVEGSSLPDQIAMPALVHLRVLGGPSVSTQMSFVNGQSSQSRSWTWLLQPIKPGHAEGGAVQVQGGGGAPAIPIDVVAARLGPPPPQQQRSFDPFEGMLQQRQAMPEWRLSLEAKPSRSTLFVADAPRM